MTIQGAPTLSERRPTLQGLLALTTCLMGMAGCGTIDQKPTDLTELVPEGPGHWVRIDEGIEVASLAGRRVIMAYGPPLASGGARIDVPGAPMAMGSADDLIAYRVVAVAHPVAGGDRCPMEIVGLILVHRHAQNEELRAQGYVVDNSDGRRGFRIDVSPTDQQTPVIPAHATATAIFTAAVIRALP